MTTDKPPVVLYGAIGVLLFALSCSGMYIAYLRGQVNKMQAGTPAAGTLRAEPAQASPATQQAAAPIAQAPPPAQVAGGRTLTPEQRSTMLEKLGGAQGGVSTSSPVWFATTLSDPESVAYQRALQSVFEDAGWQVMGVSPVRFYSKPGIFLFSGDEEPPEYVQRAVDALEAIGLTPMVGRGYREFYKEKKKENPNWQGFELTDDQAYVIVVGRKGDDGAQAAPAASAQ